MRSHTIRGLLVLCTFVLYAGTGRAQQPTPSQAVGVPAASRSIDNYLNLPLAFEQRTNGPAESWVARGQGYSIGIEGAKTSIGVVSGKGQRSRALSLEFAGAQSVRPVPGSQLPGKLNYILGNDPKQWKLGLAAWGTLTLPSVYPGIDVVYYGNQRQLEFDFVVQPGVDPAAIRMKIGGAGNLSIDGSGALNLGNDANRVRISLPKIYQDSADGKKNVSGRFAIRGSDEVAFSVDSYDRTRPLVIDPTIVYSTLLGGGTSFSEGHGIALDSSGNIYVTGYTYASDFPVVNAAQGGLNVPSDGFVTKINAAGNALIYSTYIGGSSYDYLSQIAVDSSGAAWVTGYTESTDFPVLNATQSVNGGSENAVVAKFSAAGVLQFSTYLGGSGEDLGEGIATDGSNAYVTGAIYGGTFPTSAGAFQTTSMNSGYDAFVTKFSSAGSIVYSTLLSGSSQTEAEAVAADSSANAYVTGFTYSSSFGAVQLGTNSGGDAFVAKINPAGTNLVYGKLFGGSGFDYGSAIAVDAANNAYIAGYTYSTNLPVGTSAPQTSFGGDQDGFVAKLNAAGTTFTWATYLGGSRQDQIYSLALDGNNNVYVTGYTQSTNFPTASALQPSFQGNGTSLFQTTNAGGQWSPFDGNIPGVVYDISVDPTSPATILVNTDSGIYYTSNNGGSWTLRQASCCYLARSPSAPATIYAGEYSIYVSTDNGLTFNFAGSVGSTYSPSGIVADPVTASTAYAFGYSGVYVTTNQGVTWSAANTGLPPSNGQSLLDVTAMAASGDGSLYAGVQGFGIYKSTNQGATWTAVNSGLPEGSIYPYPHSLNVSKVNPSSVYLAYGNIYKTTNGGVSWTALSGSVPGGAYQVVESPSGAALYASNFSGGVYESTDGGNTWTFSGTGLSSTSFSETSEIVFDPSNSSRAFAVVPVNYQGFVAEVNSAGTALTYSTYLGGQSQTYAYGVAANSAGDAFVTGYTDSRGDFPVTGDALQSLANLEYTAFVTRISGSTGSCAFAVTPSAPTLNGFSQSLTFSVVGPSGCAWSASSNQLWATITAGVSGSGSGFVTAQFAANSSGAARSATLTIGGQSVTVTQADSSCPFTLGTYSFPLGIAGGAVSTTLTTNQGCPWALTNNYPFAISPSPGPSGTGSGTINLTVAANGGLNSRSFSLNVGTSYIYISQAGACTFTLSPMSASPGAAGGTGSFTVTPSSSGCNWSVSSDSSWLTVASGGSGTGNGTVNYSVAANSGAARTGHLSIGFTQFTVTQAAGIATTTTALTSSPNPSTYGQSITLTATVSPPPATVTVTFKDGPATLGTVTYSNASATFIVSTLAAGTHSLTAVYAGDSNDAGSTSPVLNQTVNIATPTVALISSANPSAAGQSVTLIAAVSPFLATGTVTFMDGAATLGTGTLSGGTATLSVSTFSTGTHSLTAAYGGDANDNAGTSGILTQTVDQPTVTTTTTLAPSLNPSEFGQSVTLTATVSPSAATGNVTFYDGTTVLGTRALAGGQASLTTSLLPSGVRSLKAYFGLGATYAASSSPVVVQTVNALPASGFAAASSTGASGGYSYSVAVADFNGDGKPDFAGVTGSGVSVVLGNGDGTFQTPVSYSAGGSTEFVATGDFNGDGKTDLVVANRQGAVSVLLGNGDGTFQPAVSYPAGSDAFFLAVADFNGDGKADLAVSSNQAGISVLLGNGDGTFQAAATYASTFSALWSDVAGDFNGDGKVDLVISDTGGVNVLLGKGDGTFQAPLNSAGSCCALFFAAGDFNGDGKLDLAASGNLNGLSDRNVVEVFLGNGDGTFQAPVSYAVGDQTSFAYVAAGDFNGDGKLDLAVPNYGSGNVSVLLGNGDGTFQAALNYAVGTNPQAIGVGDFNGDGRTDLVVNGSPADILLGIPAQLAPTTTALTSSANPSMSGQSITLTATVSPSTATGTVTFNDGTTPIGMANLSGGSGALVISTLAVGMHSLTASYGGDTNDAASISAILTQVVNVPVQPLTITTPFVPSGTPGQQVNLQFTATGGTGIYTWSIVSQSQGLSLQISPAGLLTGFYPNTTASYTLTVGVRDTAASTATQAYEFPVNYPSLTLGSGAAPSGTVGQPYSFSPSASGGSGSYSWSASGVPGLQIDSHSGNVTGTPTTPGTFTLTVTVTDTNTSLTASATYSVTIAPKALSITTTGLPNGAVGVAYPSTTLTASGGTGSYAWSGSGAPPGINVSSVGLVSGTPTAGGTFSSFAVTVTDTTSKQTSSQTYSVVIAFGALMMTGPASLGGFAPGANVSASYTASGGKPPYAWSLSGAPSGFAVNGGSGALAGVAPRAGGNYGFTITVMDSQSPASSASLTGTFSVLGFTTMSPLPAGSTTAAYSANILATGGTPPYTFAASGVPAGLSLSSSGFLSGTPTAAGSFSIAVMVTDSQGVSVSGSFALTITTASIPVQVSGASLPDGTVTTSYSQALEADGGKPPYSWSVIGGSLPSGLMLSSSGTISGTPTATGLSTFTARATDTAGGFASAAFTIMIDPNGLHLTSISLPNGIAGSLYPEQTIAATGGMPPYTSFAITSGSLPPGIAFSNDFTSGAIGGMPTSAGSYAFTVTATDQAGNTASGSYSLVVQPAHADLILSQGSVSFALAAGATGLPAGNSASISILSSSTAFQQLNYAATSSGASWLDVSGGPTTPSPLAISLDPSAVNLAPGNYQASVAVTCQAPSPCKGSTQSVSASLTVTSPAPQLSLSTALLSFSATGLNPQTLAQSLGLQNTGGGTITGISASSPDPWVAVSGVPSMLTAGQSVPVTVTVSTAGLAAGYYQSTITVTSSAGSATVSVTLLISANPTLTLNPAGSQFLTVAGIAPGNTQGSFLVSVSGSSTVNWTASVPNVANANTQPSSWLTLNTTSGSSTSSSPGTVSFSIAPAGLGAGAYYATIRVTADQVVDSPQDYLVVLSIAPASISTINPSPGGLIFIAAPSSAPPPQTVQVFVSAATTASISYLATPSTSAGGSWLSASPAMGTTSPASPGQSTISVTPGNLAPGVYRGAVAYQLQSGGSAPAVNVTLIVQNAAGNAAPSGRISISAVSSSCTPSQIIAAQTGLPSNFAQPTSWPTPLTIKLLDDCTNPIPNGQVIATFTNGDPPLILQPVDTVSGTYSGTWTPHSTAPQVMIAARATAPSLAPYTLTISGQVTPNVAPVLSPNGTVNIFVPVAGSPLAPGMIVQIYGLNMAAQSMPSSTVPLTTSLANTSVLIGGVQAPLYYVSPTQINAQVPFELTVGKPYEVLIDANGALSTPSGIQVGPDDPGIASLASGQIIAQHGATGALVTDANPAAPGEYVVFYVAGMGLTTQTVGSGQPSPSSPVATTLDQPMLTLNGQSVPIAFAGLTPTFVGLYQVNFQVPANAPNGDLQLVLTQSGGQSNSTVLAVHN